MYDLNKADRCGNPPDVYRLFHRNGPHLCAFLVPGTWRGSNLAVYECRYGPVQGCVPGYRQTTLYPAVYAEFSGKTVTYCFVFFLQKPRNQLQVIFQNSCLLLQKMIFSSCREKMVTIPME